MAVMWFPTNDEFWEWMQGKGPNVGRPLVCPVIECGEEHDPEDLQPDDAEPERTTWQQWQCQACGSWNDWQPRRAATQ